MNASITFFILKNVAMVEAFSLPIFLPLTKKLFTIFFLIYHLRHAIILLFFDTTHPNTWDSTTPSRSLLSAVHLLHSHFDFACWYISNEPSTIIYLMIKSEIQAYFTNDYFIIFRNNTSNDIWHSATPSTSPLSILFSQSLIAVVNRFRTRHQSCFNSLCISTEVRLFYQRLF